MRSVPLVLMFSLLVAAPCANKKVETPKAAQSVGELRQQLKKIIEDSNTPGLSVSIVRRNGPEWVAGLGKSNVAANQAASEKTLFRIGSVSKSFVSLSILKLASEGKLSLQDAVSKLVPEIWFENRWEATDPVRVVDLLEHTTGWDDMHLRSFAKDAKVMTLREGLDYDRHSRVSRWRPGTRMAYSNSGPPVAAYIVEKLTGQRFEDYVWQNFFRPLGMKTATYFEYPSPQATTLYHRDGHRPYPYRTILLRPAGAINASAEDMAAYLQFFLNRGEAGEKKVMPARSIDRMETPTRTWQAQQGLKAGYGLGNFTSIHEGFVYHGHNGAVDGGLTDMAYLPEYGVGYFYSINSDNREAFSKIGDAIRKYLTRGFTKPTVPMAAALPPDAQEYAGWYEPVSPRNEFMHFSERLGLHRVRFERGNLVFSNLIGMIDQSFAPVTGEQFRYLPDGGPAEPIATAALLPPAGDGRFVAIGLTTLKRVPTWFGVTEIFLFLWFVLALYTIPLYAPFWILGGLIRKRRRPAERAIRVWPLIAVLSLLASMTIWIRADDEVMGNLTVWSLGLFLSTSAFAVASAGSALALWRARKREIRRSVYWYSIAVTSGLLIATVYFAFWGIIGVRVWA